MTLERIEHKVFASEAPLEEMGQFGSALATTKLNTKDVAEIQALPAYTKGWGSAIISENNYPAMEEMNGVLNVMSYHTGYLYQEGIPTYSATQEYSVTSWVKDLAGKNIYRSLKGDNKGNPLEDGTSWELFDFNKGALKTNQITNCLLEVPQRIKYTLEDGTLTIKAGSVVIVPYGTENRTSEFPVGSTFINDNFKVYDTQFEDGKFFVWAELVNDAFGSGAGTAVDRPIFVRIDENVVHGFVNVGSSTENYTGNQNYMLYNTDENVMKLYDTGKLTNWLYSLPLGVVTGNGTYLFNSIKQVFNGMGYIGSTMWVDKGVKGLIPNGRNENGTLNNIEFTTSKISTTQSSSTGNLGGYLNINSEGAISLWAKNTSTGARYYDYNKNFFYGNDSWHSLCTIAELIISNGAIDTFSPKMGVNILSYTDKRAICSWGMPSDKYIDLTLGATGSTYTAPANGWALIGAKSTATNQHLTIASGMNSRLYSSANGQVFRTYIPVNQGDNFTIAYTMAVDVFKFFYAEGEV